LSLLLFLVLPGGRSGLGWPWFESGHNAAPFMPHQGNSNYNAILGLMTVVGRYP